MPNLLSVSILHLVCSMTRAPLAVGKEQDCGRNRVYQVSTVCIHSHSLATLLCIYCWTGSTECTETQLQSVKVRASWMCPEETTNHFWIIFSKFIILKLLIKDLTVTGRGYICIKVACLKNLSDGISKNFFP